MGLITYAQEIMYLSIALGVLLVAGAFFWLLLLFIGIIRDTRTILTKAKATLEVAHEVVQSAKHKLEDITSSFGFLFSGMKTVLAWIDERRDTKGQAEEPDMDNDQKTKKS